MIVRETESLGISVSAIAQGTWSMGGDKHWGPADETNSIHTIRTSLDSDLFHCCGRQCGVELDSDSQAQ